MVALIPIVLRQAGVVGHLPDPPGEVWDSDGIVMSKAAHPFGIPDGALGLASYAITVGLIASRSSLLRAKLVCDAGAAGFNVVRQVVTFGKVCSWCMAAAGFTVPMVWFGWRAGES
jgi:uncharacterized membrane protein